MTDHDDTIARELDDIDERMRVLGERRNEIATGLGFFRSGKGRWICQWCSRPVRVGSLAGHEGACPSPRRRKVVAPDTPTHTP